MKRYISPLLVSFTALIVTSCGAQLPIQTIQVATPAPVASIAPQSTTNNPTVIVNINPSPSPSNINPGPFPVTDQLTSAEINNFYCVLDATKGLVACSNQGAAFLPVLYLTNAVSISLGTIFPFCARGYSVYVRG